jgi:hypothetical protein
VKYLGDFPVPLHGQVLPEHVDAHLCLKRVGAVAFGQGAGEGIEALRLNIEDREVMLRRSKESI